MCNHQTKREGWITSDSGSYGMRMPLSDNGSPDYCLECIGKMEIKCAWCENPIRIGDPVTLYIPREPNNVPKHAVKYHDDSKCVVGCLRWNCADSGMDRQGFWTPPGQVLRVPSPMEMLLADEGGDRAVVVSDLSDPSNIGKLI